MKNFWVFFCLLFIQHGFSLRLHTLKIAGISHTSPNTVRSFVPELLEGRNYSLKKLQTLVSNGIRRMKRSGWFYSVEGFVVKSRQNPRSANVIFILQEGFLWRFGGGGFFASVGYDNLFGHGESVGFTLGWNRQEAFFGIPLWDLKNEFLIQSGRRISEKSILQTNNVVFKDFTRNFLSFSLTHRIFYDFFLSAEACLNDSGETDANSLQNMSFVSLSGGWDTLNNVLSSSSGSSFLINLHYYPESSGISASLSARSVFPLTAFLNLALETRWIYQTNLLPEYCENLAGINGIFESLRPELFGNHLWIARSEWRIPLFHQTLAIFPVRSEALIFANIGKADWSLEHSEASGGLGLRLFFDSPVNVPLRLEGGWNKEGEFTLFFDSQKAF